MKKTNKLATVLIVLIIYLSLLISVYGEMNTKSYSYASPLDQNYLFNNLQLQSPFDYNIKSDEHANRINLYLTHLHDTQFLSESSSDPTAGLILGNELIISTDDNSINTASATTDISNIRTFSNYSEVSGILDQEIELMGPRADFVFEKNFIVGSDSDSLLNGEYNEKLWYILYMENFADENDTVMGDLEFHATTSNAIEHVDWEEYAYWNSSHVEWYFPSPEFILYDYDKLFTGFSTDYSESKNFNMDMNRSFNETKFNSNGYQMGTFKVTFKDNNMQWIRGKIQVSDFADVNVNLIPGSLWTDAPLDEYWIDSNRFKFSINPEDVEQNKEYTFTVITEITIPPTIERAGINFTYKPGFNVELNNGETFNNGGEGYSTSIPLYMLPDQVTSASASSNISNIWTLISRNQIIGDLHQINYLDSIIVEDFDVTPVDSISVNNPANISANVTGINLYNVGFLVIEPESGTVPIAGYMDNISGDQYEGSWNAKIFSITDGTTTVEPLVIIPSIGLKWSDEEIYWVMGFIKINDSTDYQYVVAVFYDTQLIDILDGEYESILDQIEDGITVFNPVKLAHYTEVFQLTDEELIINQEFNLIENLAPSMPYDIRIVANDDYHMCSEFNSGEITIFVDNTPPNVIITSPANKSFINSPIITILGYVTDDFGIKCSFFEHEFEGGNLDSEGCDVPPIPTSITINRTVTLHEGWNRLSFNYIDVAGNLGNASIVLTLDTNLPIITIDPVTPPTNLYYKRVIVTGTVESGATVEVTCPTATVSTVINLTDTTWSVEVTDLSGGINTITAVATDNAGNQNTTTMTVYLESTSTLSIGSANALPNSTITIPVSIANVTNISGISFDLLYNSSVVTVGSAGANESFIGSSIALNIDNANSTTGIVLTNSNLISALAETPVIDITFNITGGSGSNTSLDLQNVEFNDSEFNSYTPVVVVDGMITVGIKGDFNDNGKVDIGDIAEVAFMVTGIVPEDLNADFNGNGRVDIGDAEKIAFYLAGKVSEL